jgi:hypothetical protein
MVRIKNALRLSDSLSEPPRKFGFGDSCLLERLDHGDLQRIVRFDRDFDQALSLGLRGRQRFAIREIAAKSKAKRLPGVLSGFGAILAVRDGFRNIGEGHDDATIGIGFEPGSKHIVHPVSCLLFLCPKAGEGRDPFDPQLLLHQSHVKRGQFTRLDDRAPVAEFHPVVRAFPSVLRYLEGQAPFPGDPAKLTDEVFSLHSHIPTNRQVLAHFCVENKQRSTQKRVGNDNRREAAE